MAFTPITTQEDLDKVISERIYRERAKFADYDDLKKQIETLTGEKSKFTESLDAEKKNVSDLTAQLAESAGKAKAAEAKTLRLSAAAKFNLPLEMADRLVGEDEETISKDAEALANFFKGSRPAPPLGSTEGTGMDAKEAAMRAVISKL